MAVWQRQNFDLRETGVSVSIPNNDIAKCMYYLQCVCNVIDCEDANLKIFTNYRNYRALSDDEDEMVYKLCLMCSPDILDEKVFIENEALCGSSHNNFFELSAVKNTLGVVGSIFIAGRTREVKKIMTYKMSWMHTFYLEPMARLADHFNPSRQLARALIENDCTIA
jgi:hypothetical protein